MRSECDCALQLKKSDSPLRKGVLPALALLFLVAASSAQANSPTNLKQGWNGDAQLGALASFGETDSSAITALTSLTFRSIRWEHELEAKYYRSASESLVALRDENNELQRDSNGDEIYNTVNNVTNDRRFFSAESRWFYTPKYYLFGIADLDVNKPANLAESSRAVWGVGYKVYDNKKNFLTAGIGIGSKKRVETSGSRETGTIAYLTVGFKRELGEKLVLSMDWDSDFSDDDRYSEAQATLTWQLRDPLSLKIKYELQFDSTPIDSFSTFDDNYNGAFSVNLAIDIF